MRVKSRQRLAMEGEQGQPGRRMPEHGLGEWCMVGACHRDGPPRGREPAGLGKEDENEKVKFC